WKTYGELFTMMALAELPAPLRTLIRILGPLMFKDPITRAGARVASAGLKRYFMILEQRDALVAALERFFGDYDAWITPVTPAPAFLHRKMGKIHTPIDVDGRKIPGNIGGIGYTCPFNLTGHPAVLMPLTLTREGLPLGVQLVGPLWGDMDLLNAAEALSQITPAFTPPPMK
ncbi:hypothetical protein KKF84_00705, partial [Myxococcota bacterium]|nr:hypothetical protein [Myxococcota bacterium]